MFRAALPAVAAVISPLMAAQADQLIALPGFKVELLRSAQAVEGSWIGLAIDEKGRLYLAPQEDKCPILRATLDESGHVEKIEPLPFPLSKPMGMLWAYQSLYVSADGPEGRGIYRIFDDDRDGNPDRLTLFKKVPGGGGEHGAQAIVLGPDRQLYIVMGNATPLVDGIAEDSPFRNYAEDDLLPRIKDPVATSFNDVKSPYGHVLRTDENGNRWELWCAGLCHAGDIDFDPQGNLFTHDGDMEGDVGLPWYRPTRVLHLVAGGEFGFREGSAKWPEYYVDSLPAALNVGHGSPSGIAFGTRSNWPDRWRRALYVADLTFGRILAVHLEPRGAGFTGRFDEILKCRGMPVTDVEFGIDGAMFFTVGGRGTQGGLYRLSLDAATTAPAEPAAPVSAAPDPPASDLRFGPPIARLDERLWRWLGSEDRRVSRAAGLVVESIVATNSAADSGDGRPGLDWEPDDLDPVSRAPALEFLLAMARSAGPREKERILRGLDRLAGLIDVGTRVAESSPDSRTRPRAPRQTIG